MIEFKKEVNTLQCRICGGIEGVKTVHISRQRAGDNITTFDICRNCMLDMAEQAIKGADAKGIGNGWTVDVIAHILKGLKYEQI